MKALIAIVALCAGLALAGCGSDDSTTDSATTDQSTASAPDESFPRVRPNGLAVGVTKRAKPKVEAPADPPPDELVVRDIEEGDGPAVDADDTISVNYVGVYYKDGKLRESTWPASPPPEFEMDGPVMIEGWKQGLEGMRLGGRRELIVPPDLSYKEGTMIFVIDLVALK